MGDFNLQKIPSRRLRTLWELKNRVLLEECYIFNAVIPPEGRMRAELWPFDRQSAPSAAQFGLEGVGLGLGLGVGLGLGARRRRGDEDPASKFVGQVHLVPFLRIPRRKRRFRKKCYYSLGKKATFRFVPIFTDCSDFLGRLQASKTTTRKTLNTLGVEESSCPRRVLHF